MNIKLEYDDYMENRGNKQANVENLDAKQARKFSIAAREVSKNIHVITLSALLNWYKPILSCLHSHIHCKW